MKNHHFVKIFHNFNFNASGYILSIQITRVVWVGKRNFWCLNYFNELYIRTPCFFFINQALNDVSQWTYQTSVKIVSFRNTTLMYNNCEILWRQNQRIFSKDVSKRQLWFFSSLFNQFNSACWGKKLCLYHFNA